LENLLYVLTVIAFYKRRAPSISQKYNAKDKSPIILLNHFSWNMMNLTEYPS